MNIFESDERGVLDFLSKTSSLKAQTMSYAKAYIVAVGSLLAGAAVVHNIFKPDLVSKAAAGKIWTVFFNCVPSETHGDPCLLQRIPVGDHPAPDTSSTAPTQQ